MFCSLMEDKTAVVYQKKIQKSLLIILPQTHWDLFETNVYVHNKVSEVLMYGHAIESGISKLCSVCFDPLITNHDYLRKVRFQWLIVNVYFYLLWTRRICICLCITLINWLSQDYMQQFRRQKYFTVFTLYRSCVSQNL